MTTRTAFFLVSGLHPQDFMNVMNDLGGWDGQPSEALRVSRLNPDCRFLVKASLNALTPGQYGYLNSNGSHLDPHEAEIEAKRIGWDGETSFNMV